LYPLLLRVSHTDLIGKVGGEFVRFREGVEPGGLSRNRFVCGSVRPIGLVHIVPGEVEENLVFRADVLVDAIVLLVVTQDGGGAVRVVVCTDRGARHVRRRGIIDAWRQHHLAEVRNDAGGNGVACASRRQYLGWGNQTGRREDAAGRPDR